MQYPEHFRNKHIFEEIQGTTSFANRQDDEVVLCFDDIRVAQMLQPQRFVSFTSCYTSAFHNMKMKWKGFSSEEMFYPQAENGP